MAVHPLRPATDRCHGEPLPHHLANQARIRHLARASPRGLLFSLGDAALGAYPVLAVVSNGCPGLYGWLSTCYSPVRH